MHAEAAPPFRGCDGNGRDHEGGASGQGPSAICADLEFPGVARPGQRQPVQLRLWAWVVKDQVRSFSKVTVLAGWTAVSLAATLLDCAVFRLEPCLHSSSQRRVQARVCRGARETTVALPVLGRTHLGSFPPCEDHLFVERLRSPPDLF